jgi:flagella basal body P-ring formation protein FlgA
MVAGIRHSWCLIGLAWMVGAIAFATEPGAGALVSSQEDTDVVVLSVCAQVEVNTAVIAVGDLASLHGGSPALRQQIAGLDLADALGAGQSLRISSSQIAYRLQLAGIAPRCFCLQGAPSTQVSRSVLPAPSGEVSLAGYRQPGPASSVSSYQVPEDDLVTAAWQHLLQHLPWRPGDVTIKLAQAVPGPIRIAASKEEVHLEAELASVGSLLGKVRVDVSIYAKTKKYTVVPIYLNVDLRQTVAVVIRRIEIGETFSEDNTRFDLRSVDASQSYLASAESLAGKRARRLLVPGHLVTSSEVEAIVVPRPVLVKQREMVRLVARIGSLQVTAVGEALQDGCAGDPIRVRNVDSKTILLGRVVERSVVEVGN